MQTTIQLLTEAKTEITQLRRQNELMKARLDMFDDVMQVLHTNGAYQSQGLVHPDIVYSIEKHITDLNVAEK